MGGGAARRTHNALFLNVDLAHQKMCLVSVKKHLQNRNLGVKCAGFFSGGEE